MLLSGTPALSKPAELYTQLSSLLPGAKLTLNAFGERYCKGTAFDKLAGCQNEGELNMILVCGFLLLPVLCCMFVCRHAV